jgi:CheY-like chemotaxis protein
MGSHDTPSAEEPLGRVLVIDDEEALLRTFRRILEPLYEVITTDSPVAALELMMAAPAFDVVICDLRMPEMNGIAVHEEITRRRPEVAARFLFVTASHDGDGLRGRPVLAKPTGRRELLDAVAAVLGERVGA